MLVYARTVNANRQTRWVWCPACSPRWPWRPIPKRLIAPFCHVEPETVERQVLCANCHEAWTVLKKEPTDDNE